MITAYLKRAYSSFAAHVFDVPPRLLAFLLFVLHLVLPVAKPDPFIQLTVFDIFFLAAFAASWDLLVGRSGQISLGHALFFGIGGYTTGILSVNLGLAPWITIPLAVLVGVSASLLIGLPCSRVKGPYLALVTMALPLILVQLFKLDLLLPITGGEAGVGILLPIIPSAFFRMLGFGSRDAIRAVALATYYFALFLVFAASVILYKIANSKTGMVFVSILDDELASKACGINVTRYKLMALAISSLFAALIGAIRGHFATIVSPGRFLDLTVSFAPVMVAFLGGIGTIYGPLIGAYIYYTLDRFVLQKMTQIPFLAFTDWEHVRFLIFAVIVIVLVIKWPRGIARFVTDKLHDLEEARDLDERGKWIWKTYKKRKKKE
ncbi:MAG: branched-chain amino acid ABC transporter permease [Candidatus Bathyarchaeota archaeon]|nr:branched-chain amino acid ABC transporter permease [Candidatus Bathyarchaeota archaeon]MDH5733476.1 branched-chain amino acid ABC transporter permease [Candidatus Bathyarchaeota archaeon]